MDSKKLYQELISKKNNNDKFNIVEFIPKSISSSKFPKYLDEKCFGIRNEYIENPIEWTIQLFEIMQWISLLIFWI